MSSLLLLLLSASLAELVGLVEVEVALLPAAAPAAGSPARRTWRRSLCQEVAVAMAPAAALPLTAYVSLCRVLTL